MTIERHTPAREGVRRLSVAHFLAALAAWIVTAPFLSQWPYAEMLDAVLLTLVLLSAVMAVGGRRRTLIMAAVLVAPAVIATWVHHFRPDVTPGVFRMAAAAVFIAFVAVHLLRFILRAPWVNSEVLCAAVATYLLLGLLWGFAYELTAVLNPQSFVFTIGANRSMIGFEALYFSFGTLTNYYGDIIPVSNAARMLAMMEATIGMFYVVVLIARLVSLYASQPTPDTSKPVNDRL